MALLSLTHLPVNLNSLLPNRSDFSVFGMKYAVLDAAVTIVFGQDGKLYTTAADIAFLHIYM